MTVSFVFWCFTILSACASVLFFFFFNDPASTEIYTLSLHDALPIFCERCGVPVASDSPCAACRTRPRRMASRSEEHTSELQSPYDLVCRLLLEKKKNHLIIRSRYEVLTASIKSPVYSM